MWTVSGTLLGLPDFFLPKKLKWQWSWYKKGFLKESRVDIIFYSLKSTSELLVTVAMDPFRAPKKIMTCTGLPSSMNLEVGELAGTCWKEPR
jgi:hypothetical protein